ncbi:MAG: glycosyltransferase family 9 protein [Actinomycetota bacterium]|nr:glycosyltransferase family 9 protein [Actinomycetota bacterium]
MAQADAPVLVVLRALGLGDFLTIVPALRALAQYFPDHRRILAAPLRLAPLVRLTDTVHAVVDARPLEPLPSSLHRPDVAVNLHGRGPQSHRILLALRPRRLVAFEHADVPETSGFPRWREDEHEVLRWCRLLSETGVPANPLRLDLMPPALTSERDEAASIVHPGAGSVARRWPISRWASVARHEQEAGRRVLVTGNAEERDECLALAGQASIDPSCVYAGLLDLDELASLVARAGRVACGDTGIAHLATAVGTPSVVLFGPTSPALWGPLKDVDAHLVLWKGTLGDAHAGNPHDGLLAISVEEVIGALGKLPLRSRAPSVVV